MIDIGVVLRQLSDEDKVAWALLCVKEIYSDPHWQKLATSLLNGDCVEDLEIYLCNIKKPRYNPQLNLSVNDRGYWTIRAASWFIGPRKPVFNDSIDDAARIVLQTIGPISESILYTKIICPHCHQKSSMHTEKGVCLFGPYFWEDINDAYKGHIGTRCI